MFESLLVSTKSHLYVVSLAACLAFSHVGTSSAQDDIGECSAAPMGVDPGPSAPLYKLDDVEYFEEDLPNDLRQALFDVRMEHYHKQLELIDAAILGNYLRQTSVETGKSLQVLAGELFSGGRPDDQAVDDFYAQNRARIEQPLEQVREQIRQMLGEQAAREKRTALIESLKLFSAFEIGISKPLGPVVEIVTDGYPRKGPVTAPVTIVEFADYQCPHCKVAAAALSRIVGEYPDDVQVVFMDFPVNRSGISRVVAKGGVCAAEQDSFWPYHDLAFERQESLSADSPLEIATALGLERERFSTCYASDLAEERVASSEAEAVRLGVGSTPTLFLNGRRLQLRNLDEELRDAVETELAEKES